MLLLRILHVRGCSLGVFVWFLRYFPVALMSLPSHPRSHLPLMFVGMEHIMLSNHVLADEALNASNSMCDGDPLLINERGVMAFTRGE
jgi:hypothetical protein